MSNAYLVGQINVIDPEKWAAYCSQVPDTLSPWGAEIVFRGRRAAILAGDHQYNAIVVIRFPDIGAINAWHESTAYHALVKLREQAADVVLLSYET